MIERGPSSGEQPERHEFGWNPDWGMWDEQPVIQGLKPDVSEGIYERDEEVMAGIVETLRRIPSTQERDRKILQVTSKLAAADHYLRSQLAALESDLRDAEETGNPKRKLRLRQQIERREESADSLRAAEDRLFELFTGPEEQAE